ncbi:DUF1707 SHOCT-like domain-containing protein [Nocardia jinanensis]|uniref:DUF1707 domain-containing protein n=1 Tax=Nocardia jinanensis TaxID=382504 RepID=A0A917RT96_9NOCA|nr:DUF1707 domain-containing protein [Nocardia jinanensis]GGL27213.1 hypothetical protein GCM10011588_47490 [Nocardia jinanensis]
MSTAVPADSIRARDIDRAETSTLLDAAYAEGQLEAGEYHDRVAQARAAKTLGDLRRLTVDLQTPVATGTLPSGAARETRPPVSRTGSETGYPPRTRARDADRANAGELIDAGRRDGQLTEDEHRILTELLGSARTLGELADLVADLQGRRRVPTRPVSPVSGRNPALLLAAGLVAAFVGFAVTSPDSDPPMPEAGSESAAGTEWDDIAPVVIETPDLLTGAGLAHFLDGYRAKFGDMAADSIYLHPDFATIDRAVPGAPNREVGYDYRGGFTQSGDITTRRTGTQPVDLGLLDPAAIGAAAANAVGATRVPGGAVSMMIVDIESSGDLAGRPVVRIVVRNEFDETGSVYIDPVGAILDISIFEG